MPSESSGRSPSKGWAMLVLRFKDKSHREWKVPFNIKLGSNEFLWGWGPIAAILFSIAGINLLTKQVATVSGVAFTLIFFIIFLISERINQRKLDNPLPLWTSSDWTTSKMSILRLSIHGQAMCWLRRVIITRFHILNTFCSTQIQKTGHCGDDREVGARPGFRQPRLI